jgi:hypothetical protein
MYGRNAYKIVFRKPEEKGSLRRLKCRWEDNIKIALKGIVCEIVACIYLVQNMVQ